MSNVFTALRAAAIAFVSVCLTSIVGMWIAIKVAPHFLGVAFVSLGAVAIVYLVAGFVGGAVASFWMKIRVKVD